LQEQGERTKSLFRGEKAQGQKRNRVVVLLAKLTSGQEKASAVG
jgi:hypothetical protein